MRDANQCLHFCVILAAAIVTGIAIRMPEALGKWEVSHSVLLAVPFLFSTLGIMYLRQHEEAYLIAGYLQWRMRPALISLARSESLWRWEDWKATWGQFHRGSIAKLLLGRGAVMLLRVLPFLLPSLLSIVLLAQMHWPLVRKLSSLPGPLWTSLPDWLYTPIAVASRTSFVVQMPFRSHCCMALYLVDIILFSSLVWYVAVFKSLTDDILECKGVSQS